MNETGTTGDHGQARRFVEAWVEAATVEAGT